jgi:hypothetical protein
LNRVGLNAAEDSLADDAAGASAADLKFLHRLQQARSGTSNRLAALE